MSAAPDEEELCDTLQEHIERLEQRDLASMRQGAVLRRKLEAAEQELRELRRDRHGALQAAQRRAQERRQAEESEMARRGEAAARALEAEFHGRWEAARGREEQLEERLRAASGRQRQLEADLSFWRCCGQELVRGADGGPHVGAAAPAQAHGPPAEGPAAAARAEAGPDGAVALGSQAAQAQAEAEALRQRCRDLEAQLLGVQRMANEAQVEEEQLRLRCASARAACARAAAAAAAAGEREAAALRAEEALGQEEPRRAPPPEPCWAGPALPGGVDDEELARLGRKKAEKEKEVALLQQQRSRLQASLRRHEGPPGPRSGTAPALELEAQEGRRRGSCAALDETASWLAMLMFKSQLIRGGFCVHLGLLYGWLLFLLWFLSSRSPAGQPLPAA